MTVRQGGRRDALGEGGDPDQKRTSATRSAVRSERHHRLLLPLDLFLFFLEMSESSPYCFETGIRNETRICPFWIRPFRFSCHRTEWPSREGVAGRPRHGGHPEPRYFSASGLPLGRAHSSRHGPHDRVIPAQRRDVISCWRNEDLPESPPCRAFGPGPGGALLPVAAAASRGRSRSRFPSSSSSGSAGALGPSRPGSFSALSSG